ncbi:fungal-specific transcription factor domain-containing protein [Xylariales sp. PMI_506]|nr:fungal-specific transcription factor domain-containing protein [Xylariales sp. PMI_506]
MRDCSKAKRTRTFTGCRTCRSRRAKCDEAQPACGTCQRLGLSCEGYEPTLFWPTESTTEESPGRGSHRSSAYRFPLSTESDRQLMTTKLLESMGNRSALSLVADLDDACEQASLEGTGVPDALRGPFGVFQLRTPTATAASVLTTLSDDRSNGSTEIHANLDDAIDEYIDIVERNSGDICVTPSSHEMFFGAPDCAADFTSSSPWDFSSMITPRSDDLSTMLWQDVGTSTSKTREEYQNVGTSSNGKRIETTTLTTPLLRDPTDGRFGHNTAMPEHAQSLLRYYRQCIEKSSKAFMPKRKSPAELLFLPCALETFAELSLWNSTSHSRSAVLRAVLASSAFQAERASVESPMQWREVAVLHQVKARQHLCNALQVEMAGTSQVEYKELIMAILAVAMTSLYNGVHTFKSYLLDAEKLIRLRGLAEHRTFPIRVLHHMYTHLRIMAESLSPEFTIGRGKQNSLVLPAEARAFRTARDALNVGLDPSYEKREDAGYNDIHLDVQGKWEKTLYPVMYCIPESLMTLLSQTISLANEKPRLEAAASIDAATLTSLADHVKTLEQNIWSWSVASEATTLQPTTSPPQNDTVPGTESRHESPRSMVLAIHQALIIYFYRRVYKVNAMLLQDRVRQTFDLLEPCLAREEWLQDQDFATSLAWPAFIAACEAVLPDLRRRALECLGALDNRGICLTPRPATEIVRSLWE